MSLSDPVNRRLMSDEAYDRIRDAVVTGELIPGERIKDTELALRLGLSRTPVREALTRLTDTGLVEAKPGVYTRITPLNPLEVARTLAVLKALDELAIRTAVPHLSKSDLDHMTRINKEFAAAVKRNDARAALDADDRFHSIPIAAADNPLLARIVDQLHPQIHRILYRKFSTLYGGENTIDHHTELVRILASGDADAAAKRSAAHWVQLGDLIGDLFAKEQLET
ncbi:GntR family transcriptional regulator [Arthrobacter bambusae]|uniref:GntR family transcriptional regulator n=1 Tax=Arthrobacter bambusae TaxID=1338426 RepID=UPI00278701A2|nr:GntR family transcriptional regulator [Arthrobacter bambusae]MDQ0241871.1 DNA-binding GntR family transcriptional regulator [Arthrobacter bambusae]